MGLGWVTFMGRQHMLSKKAKVGRLSFSFPANLRRWIPDFRISYALDGSAQGTSVSHVATISYCVPYLSMEKDWKIEMTPRNLSMYVTTMSYALRPMITQTRHFQTIAIEPILYIAQVSVVHVSCVPYALTPRTQHRTPRSHSQPRNTTTYLNHQQPWQLAVPSRKPTRRQNKPTSFAIQLLNQFTSPQPIASPAETREQSYTTLPSHYP
jgi:hypothetical protein